MSETIMRHREVGWRANQLNRQTLQGRTERAASQLPRQGGEVIAKPGVP